jgi:hypothetical protein
MDWSFITTKSDNNTDLINDGLILHDSSVIASVHFEGRIENKIGKLQ